jgi:hypothetical protein
MLQHRQPLESSRNSSDDSAKGSDADDTLIALAVLFVTSLLPTRCTVVGQTFNVLDNNNKGYRVRKHKASGHTAVSPNSFMMTAMRYPCCSVRMRLRKPPPVQNLRKRTRQSKDGTHFRSVDLPAPRNPEIIVRGTWWSSFTGISSRPTWLSISGSISVL